MENTNLKKMQDNTGSIRSRIGVFGGAFDPPHAAHVLAVAYALCCARVDKVVVIPCAQHPFDKDMSPFEARLEMTRVAFRPFAPVVEVSDIERHLPGPSYTVNTLENLHRLYPEAGLVLIIGSDNRKSFHKWRDHERILQLAELFVVGRGEGDDFYLPPISSTMIREAIRQRKDVSGLIPSGVMAVIRKYGLYQELR